MLCYRDMTFCSYWKECVRGVTCFRAKTDKVKTESEAHGFPVCEYAAKPKCFKELKQEIEELKKEIVE